MQLMNVFAFNLVLVLVLSMGRHYKKVFRDQQRGVYRHRFWMGHVFRHFHMYATFWVSLFILEGATAFIWVVALGHRVN